MLKDKSLKNQIKQEQKLKNSVQTEKEGSDRATQSFYFITLRNHINLSAFADNKANILFTVNTILLSLTVSDLLYKLASPKSSHLIIPVCILLLTSLISIVISIIVTRPNITEGKFTKEDAENNSINLAFFGNFHAMEYEEYASAVKLMLKNKTYINTTLTKDLYFLGSVLNKKYRLVRLGYTIFLCGLVISAISFAVAIKYFSGS